jgi:TDG/mug DNA glycosylase family protein
VAQLRDRVGPGLRVLFVGINPGIRSAAIGHHFAGYSNRFWKLLCASGLVPEAIGTEDDHRLPEWELGITNLIARPTSGIDALRPAEYAAGARVLRRKVRRWKPTVVVLVGVTLYRSLFGHARARKRRADRSGRGPERPALRVSQTKGQRITLGLQPVCFEGARVFVLPNPSGRNANFSYAEMLAAFRALARLRASLGAQGRDRIHRRRTPSRHQSRDQRH